MKFLVAIHHPVDYDPFASEDEAMRLAIDELNDEMVEAGVRVFVGGFKHSREARSLRINEGQEPVWAEGPYLQSKDHVAGFWVLNLESMEQAMEWGHKAAVACKAPVEVRPFH